MTDTTVTLNQSKRRWPLWPFFVAGLLLILGWLGLKAWRINQAAQSLLTRQSEVQTLLDQGFLQADPDAAEALVLGVRSDVVTLRQEAQPFLPLTPYLGWLPKVGSTAVIAPQLLEMADAGTEAAAFAMRGLKPALVLLQDDSGAEDKLADLMVVLDNAAPDLNQVNNAVGRLAVARSQISNTADLPWRVQTLLAQLDEWLPLAQDGLKMSQVLPTIAGLDGQRRYLILAQNEDELRATGGFISGAGLLVMENGRIVTLDFADAYQVDNWRNKPYEPLTSGPLYELMDLQLFLFRDANVWPDFPTSAETAMNLYSYGRDLPQLDGTIAIDQQFLQLLLDVTGPVTIPGEDVTINKRNLISNLREAWAIDDGENVREWIGSRKAFLGPFASALKDQLVSNFASLDPLHLVRNMTQAIDTGHLQLYMRDEAVATVLDELNWDGRLDPPTQSDYLLAIDTNVGYNKVNATVERGLDYQVTLSENGGGQADLTVVYTHTASTADNACLPTQYGDAPTYQQLTDQCLWNYLRIYTLADSQLLSASEHTVPVAARLYNDIATYSPQTIAEQPGFTTFTNYFLVPLGDGLTSHYQYELPPTIGQSEGAEYTYELLVQKQAGARSQPLHITVTLPPNKEFVSATPAPTAVTDTTIAFSLTLDKNTSITVHYRDK